MPQSLVDEQSGEVIEVPEGESCVGRGPVLKVKTVHHNSMADSGSEWACLSDFKSEKCTCMHVHMNDQ